MEDEGSDGTFNDKSEWSVPQLDKNRVVHIAFDCLYDEHPSSGVALLDLAKISRGAFLPQKITWDWVNEWEKSIEFTLNGVRHAIRSNGDPLILAKKINPLIVETGYQIEVWDLSPDALVVVLTPDEKQRLEEERGWRFFNLNFV
ncbi:MAG: hypothetical protein AB1861_01240 [Cyanobacteriota bacterium]